MASPIGAADAIKTWRRPVENRPSSTADRHHPTEKKAVCTG